MFKPKSSLPIGIDISDLTLKAAQIHMDGDSLFLQGLARLSQGEGVVKDGEIQDMEAFSRNIKELTSKPLYGTFSGKNAVICLPEPKTFIKLISVEKSINSLQSVIGPEIERHIPYAIGEVYYDWQTISEDQEYRHILIGVSPRQIVDQYINAFSRSGLRLSALEIEPQAVARCLLAEELEKPEPTKNFSYGIVDIGAKRTNMFIYSNYSIINSFSLPISGEESTELIAKELEITKSQAEKAKLICGLDESKAQGIIKDILSEMINNLNRKITEIIRYYSTHYAQNPALEKIIICGGGAYIKGIEGIIAEKQGIKTEIGDVLCNLNDKKDKLKTVFTETHNLELNGSEKNLSVEQDLSLRYTTAIGLALRGALKINL